MTNVKRKTGGTSRSPGAAPRSLYAVTIETGLDFAAIVETGLEVLGLDFVTWTDVDQQQVVFQEFLGSAKLAERRGAAVRSHLASWADGESWRACVRIVEPQDWRESWKKFFRTERVSDRIVIKPSWEHYAAKPGDCVIEMDPGLSFGTGQHFTTRSCLRFIDEIARRPARGRFLDLGCGSGILAIAAAKLGFEDVLAVDNDPEALAIAAENVRRNGVAQQVRCRVADIEHAGRAGEYDGVVANILANVLISHAQTMALFLRRARGCFLCVAGILTHQYPLVKAAYERLGLCEVRRLEDAAWTSGWFEVGGSRGQGGGVQEQSDKF